MKVYEQVQSRKIKDVQNEFLEQMREFDSIQDCDSPTTIRSHLDTEDLSIKCLSWNTTKVPKSNRLNQRSFSFKYPQIEIQEIMSERKQPNGESGSDMEL